MDKLQQIKALIEPRTKQEDYFADDNFNVYDYSGGNIDDAFDMGLIQGAGDLARAIQEILDA